ncbi:SMO1-3, partial [Symbiodinium necroappetens]
MLWETGLRELAGELLQDGLQLALQSIFPASSNRAAAASRLEVNKAMTNLEVFQLAGSLFERAGQQDTPSIATLLTHMGVAKGDAGDHQGAMEAFWHARRIRKVTGTLETV